MDFKFTFDILPSLVISWMNNSLCLVAACVGASREGGAVTGPETTR